MKRALLTLGIIISAFSLWSCNDDDEYSTFHYVARGIDSIAMPDSAQLGRRVEIKTYTKIKQNCQQFQTHGYDVVGNERTVTAWFVEWDEPQCGEDMTTAPYFYFAPQETGNYHFRFWAGYDDENEQDVFISKNIHIYQ